MPIPPRLRTLSDLFNEFQYANSTLPPEYQLEYPAFTTYSNVYEDLARLVDALNSASSCPLLPITRIMYGEELSKWVPLLHAAADCIRPVSDFTFTVDTTKAGSANNQFVLPLVSTGRYNFFVDWGDSSTSHITSYNQAEVTHTYGSTGTYTIKFTSGSFTGFQFNDAGDKLKITGISKWGGLHFGNVYPDFPNGVFMGCASLASITATDTPNFRGMTNLYAGFRGCTSLVSINNIQNWDLSTITNLYGLFAFCTSYNDPNIGQLDVSGVTDFSSIFFGCSNFNQDVGAWDTSNATLLTNIFYNCAKFNNGGSDSIKNWDTSNVTNMINLFRGCTVFNQDIGDWDVSNVTDMSTMFRNASVFNQDLSKWNVSKVTNMGAMFMTCPAFNNGANTDTNIVTGRSGLDGWDVSNVTSMGDMFNGATIFNRPLANWNVGKVTNMVSTFKQTAFNQDIGNWNTVSVTNMGYMFNDCPFNQDIGNWNVSKCTSFQGMFSTIVPSTFNQDLSKWDVGKCVDFQYMFRRCFAFNNGANTRVNPITGRSGIDGWNIGSNVATPSILMFNMFWSNTSNMGFNRNIGSWDMAKVTNISGMFRLCTSFNQDVSAWNTAQVTNMSEAFYNCSALKQNFGAWNVSACTNLTSMFTGCNLNAPATSTNYDALLNGWASRPVVASRSFSAGTSKYGLGAVASRAVLTGAPNLWTIADGGAI
jgi:surface protein